MDTTTQTQLTAEKVAHCKQQYNEIAKQFKPLHQLQEAGKYWVYYVGSCLEFDYLYSYLFRYENFDKVSKLKVGDNYRKGLKGWIVPEELIEQFKECLEVSRAYAALRREAIDVATKLPWNGYSRVKNLSPEKMQTLIDLFADSDE